MLKTAGRPTKYNTPETLSLLKYLVELYKEKEPYCGIVKVADMVRFSQQMNELDSGKYPLFNKDVWRTYGKSFIDEANEFMPSNLANNDTLKFNIPNVADIVQRHGKNHPRLLEHLRPLEIMLHESLSREEKLRRDKADLQVAIQTLKETISFYEQHTLQMAQHSLSQEYQEKYGLVNQISINANARNKSAMKNLDHWLSSTFDDQVSEEPQQPNKESKGLALWKGKKQK
ncbi:hypothetical protein [Paenibacillus sp. LHD-38]|uniref:hypothetical protein n=1 Tax=Paenibacillus sp. LHD-38 TaxID=3072143 RepID=UPI00280CB2BA|nr:hypothetical protein [Paenibacillus sp. LHD-38]MDQ8738869.1 hypothetical protein [Paenibacillus sp. LHD-38]